MRILEYVFLLVLILVIVKAIDLIYTIADMVYRVLSQTLQITIIPFDVSYYVALGLYVGISGLIVGIIVKMWTAIREKGEKR